MEENIELDLKEMGWDGVGRINVTQDTDKWHEFFNTVRNIPIPLIRGISWLAVDPFFSQEELCYMEMSTVLTKQER
jgi:hypothetical protein